MSKRFKPGKKSVELGQPVRVSRIRRDPVPKDKPVSLAGRLGGGSSEREIMIAILGIVLFALAIDIIVLGISTYWT